MQSTVIPTPKPGFRLEELDGEVLLLHPGETRTIYLNESASLIWRLCNGERTISELETLLAEAFPESSDNIHADLAATLSTLVEHGAVTLD